MVDLTLSALITRNRDKLGVGLATEDEIAEVIVDAPIVGPRKGLIDGWHVIAVRADGDQGPMVWLRCVGFAFGGTWMTSEVTAVARDLSAIRTQSGSVYALGRQGTLDETGDIDPRLARQVGVALIRWGVDEALDLGICV